MSAAIDAITLDRRAAICTLGIDNIRDRACRNRVLPKDAPFLLRLRTIATGEAVSSCAAVAKIRADSIFLAA
jgi:hypothetical protein